MGAYIAGASAFLLWGIFPIFWKIFAGIPPLELIAHRVTWTVVFLLIVVPLRGRLTLYLQAVRSPRQLGLYLLTGSLLACNWLTFVYAVLSNQILESSLGYFLTPLVNVFLGLVVLRERLRLWQWCAVALAAAGVLVQVIQLGRLPWIALVLATSFGGYGLLRKQGPLGPLTGLAMETTALAPFAVGFIVFLSATGADTAWDVARGQQTALFLSGAITAIPLLLFATAARSLPLTSVGLLQYLTPSVQLLVGVFVYDEPFEGALVASFALIWVGLTVYSADGVRQGMRGRRIVEL